MKEELQAQLDNESEGRQQMAQDIAALREEAASLRLERDDAIGERSRLAAYSPTPCVTSCLQLCFSRHGLRRLAVVPRLLPPLP